jgi:hypothetical protein
MALLSTLVLARKLHQKIGADEGSLKICPEDKPLLVRMRKQDRY